MKRIRKFLKLVGIYPEFAQPARVDITFEGVNKNDLNLIKAGTQVITKIDTEKFIFETEEPLTMIAGKISSVLTMYDNRN
jgi:hypothetical protein